jgi:hypothetical protein
MSIWMTELELAELTFSFSRFVKSCMRWNTTKVSSVQHYFVRSILSSWRDGDVKHGVGHSCAISQDSRSRATDTKCTVVEADTGYGVVKIATHTSKNATE